MNKLYRLCLLVLALSPASAPAHAALDLPAIVRTLLERISTQNVRLSPEIRALANRRFMGELDPASREFFEQKIYIGKSPSGTTLHVAAAGAESEAQKGLLFFDLGEILPFRTFRELGVDEIPNITQRGIDEFRKLLVDTFAEAGIQLERLGLDQQSLFTMTQDRSLISTRLVLDAGNADPAVIETVLRYYSH
jgi:hypothetical protein